MCVTVHIGVSATFSNTVMLTRGLVPWLTFFYVEAFDSSPCICTFIKLVGKGFIVGKGSSEFDLWIMVLHSETMYLWIRYCWD